MARLYFEEGRVPMNGIVRVAAGFCLTAAVFGCASVSFAQTPAAQTAASSRPQLPPDSIYGDTPADPGPLATDLSPAMRPDDIRAAMRKVADWELARVTSTPSQDWTYATLYRGFLAASKTLDNTKYADYVTSVADHFHWQLGPREFHADDQAIGQAYLQLYRQHSAPERIDPIRHQFDEILAQRFDPTKPVWWWCDALFMAPPVWSNLSAITGDARYREYADRNWEITYKLLWDPEEHLFYRDSSYFDQREKNGQKIFWSRGNGWVMGGLAAMLETLPESDPRRPFYIQVFRQMAAKVASIQTKDGLWSPGLLDAADYPLPENSGSAFFVYAFAWGINHGILDAKTYRPVVERGWKGLVSHIYADGRLGSIQPIGGAPGVFEPGTSYVFGVGAFLFAGSEVTALSSPK